jgi:hypothetical protein
VIRHPKFDLSDEMVQQWIDLIDEMTTVVTVSQQIDFPRDQKDAKFLACAISSDIDYLVTGDHDFEEAQKLGNLRIISVSQFQTLILGGEHPYSGDGYRRIQDKWQRLSESPVRDQLGRLGYLSRFERRRSRRVGVRYS